MEMYIVSNIRRTAFICTNAHINIITFYAADSILLYCSCSYGGVNVPSTRNDQARSRHDVHDDVDEDDDEIDPIIN